MPDATRRTLDPSPQTTASYGSARLKPALRAALPALLFGLRLWASVCLALYLAFLLELDNAYWAATSAALVCQPQLGASLRKCWYRMIGTMVGAAAIVLLNACFPQDRCLFLAGLALWGAVCAFAATLLRNFAGYAAALAGYTAALVASSALGATGGPDGQVFTLAVARASEIGVGIVSAGIVLAGTDFGDAQRRLAGSLTELVAEIMGGFVRTLALAEARRMETQSVRRELLGRVIALDSLIDHAIGESAAIRYYGPLLSATMDGMFAALSGWRAVAAHLALLPDEEARRDAETVLRAWPAERHPPLGRDESGRWVERPVGQRELHKAAVRRLITMPASAPSLRLLLDQSARLLAGVTKALDGVALLVAEPARPGPNRRRIRVSVPDYLPALVNGGRTLVAIVAVELFWVLTQWPNGATAVSWTALAGILMASRADEAYASAVDFTVGTALAAVCAAIILLAVLPGRESFLAFSIVLGLYLIPLGALMARPWRATLIAPMVGNFPPLLAPANQPSYDALQFYNAALAIVVGCGIAALSFRLLPPLSPAFRTRRLLMLTLRDLRCLAKSPQLRVSDDWEGHIYARLSALPAQAKPLQCAQLIAALSVGLEVIHLRRVGPQLGPGPVFGAALEALAQGNSGAAVERLAGLDRHLAARQAVAHDSAAVLRVRAGLLVMSEALSRHAHYFDAGALR